MRKIIMKIQLSHNFEDIISLDNLLDAWKDFLKGKRNKRDVQIFSFHLMDNIISLHQDLIHHSYKHGSYQAFKIFDPKLRDIHKASVRDRLLHHAIYRILYTFFDKTFIADSFSCRTDKGTHKAIDRFHSFACQVSQNNTRTCWILKCDIKKFFASINHDILMGILQGYIPDKDILWLLRAVINSFSSTNQGVGLPLGNLTSQLFVNIYMNEFDRFVKHKLKVKYYIRYADDFILLTENKNLLEVQVLRISDFLQRELKLNLHPNKVFIKTLASGVDFLGWVHFPNHRILRAATKKRMVKRTRNHPALGTYNSYLGLLGHGNASKIKRKLIKEYILSREEFSAVEYLG